jgi:hypothetical protein
MFHLLRTTLRDRLAASPRPVERDIAGLLEGASEIGQAEAFRLQRYHRKVDVAHKLMAAYDERIDKATSAETVSGDGYLGLAIAFIEAARRLSGSDEGSRADILRWVNSAFNCLDLAKPLDPVVPLGDVESELLDLVRTGSLA